MRYGFGCDHGGFVLKKVLIEELEAAGHEVVDVGTDSPERTDFPIYANEVAQGVSDGTLDAGVLVCGTGLGMELAANRFPRVRAVSVSDCYSAKMARLHNDANILCMGGRVVGSGAAVELLRAWLATDFAGGHYTERLRMMRGGYEDMSGKG